MAEKENKRNYWLKLKKNFFQQHQIKVLKSLPNGRLYALIYLELMAESTSHDGELRYSKMLPYDIITLSAVIDEDKDNVEKAIETLVNLELVEILDDGTIYLNEVNKMIGSAADNDNANRQRRFREKKKQEKLLCYESVIKNNESIEYRDKSIEYRDKNIEEEEYKREVQRYIECGFDEKIINKAMEMLSKYDKTPRNFKLAIDILTNDNIANKKGYLYECIRKEQK